MQTLVAEILSAWRRAERLTGLLPAETPEHAAAVIATEKLRELYQEVTLRVEPSSVDVPDALSLLGEDDEPPPPGGLRALS